jgi:putative ABC transport system permease protein
MQVVKVLHGGLRFGRGMHRLRNVMLGLQFSFAVILTTMVFVIKAQNDRVDEAAQVFDRDHIVNLLQIREDMRPSYDRLVSELRSIPGVLHVTGENLVPFGGGQTLREMSTSRDPEDRIVTSLYRVDEDFMSVFDVPIVAGRGFSRRRGDVVAWTDDEAAPATVNILLNELAVTEFGWDRPEDAVGRTVFEVSTDAGPSAYQIVGVVEDRDFVGIYGRLKPAMFMLQPEAFGIVSIRVAKEDVSGTVAAIDAAWNRVYPAYPITRNFLDEQFRSSFELFELISHVLSGLALMAVALAGLGLFGLAAFLAERRTKEIGLRKAMGASITGIVRLLLWQFSRPVAVALVIGTPLAVLASQQYLDFFASRVSLSPTVFAVSSALIMGFAWLTVAAHAVRVARENPVKALRYK